jgi:membrane protein DedA with SNARE-associated domain
MLFAGFAVADRVSSHAHHHLTLIGVVLAGLLGSLAGSWVAYAVGRAGRLELFERHGSKVHMGPGQIERADRWFRRYGEPVVLFGRLIPFVRAFVSLPAGIARMPLPRFTVLTLIGSLPWVLALALAGEALGSEWESVRKDFEYVDYAILALIVIAIVALIVRRRQGRAKPAAGPTE